MLIQRFPSQMDDNLNKGDNENEETHNGLEEMVQLMGIMDLHRDENVAEPRPSTPVTQNNENEEADNEPDDNVQLEENAHLNRDENIAGFNSFCARFSYTRENEETIMKYLLRLLQIITRIRFSKVESVGRLHTVEMLLAENVGEKADDDLAWRRFRIWCESKGKTVNGIQQTTILKYILEVADDILQDVNPDNRATINNVMISIKQQSLQQTRRL